MIIRKDLLLLDDTFLRREISPLSSGFAFQFGPDTGAFEDRVGVDVGRSLPVGRARGYIRVRDHAWRLS